MQQNNVDYVHSFVHGIRGFIGAILSLIIASAVTAFAGLGALPINFSDLNHTIKAIILAFVLGFLAALGNAIRAKYGNPDGSGVINKIPV